MNTDSLKSFFIYLFVMAGVTYLVRMLPFVLLRKKLNNKFIKSFFGYIPYAVLSAMTFPAILFSTSALPSAAAGLAVAILLALAEQSLAVVAALAALAVFITELFL